MLKNLLFIEMLIVLGSIVFYMASTRATRREVGHLPGIVLGVMAAIDPITMPGRMPTSRRVARFDAI